MVPPLAVAAIGLGSVYGVGRLVDTARFWHDYHKNTGYYPRYPFLTSAGGAVRSGQNVFKNLKRF